MIKWFERILFIAFIMIFLLGIILCNDKREQQEVVYDIVGVYTGDFRDDFVYFIFEPSGQYYIYIPEVPSIILDEGIYEAQGNGIFSLESSFNLDQTVVCGNSIIYDFDKLNGDVYFAKKTSKEIFSVNLH